MAGVVFVKNNNVRDLYNKMIFVKKIIKMQLKNEISKKLKDFLHDRVKDYEKYLLKFENI